MKLEFDSIGELEQFLMFSAHIGRAFAAAPSAPQTDDECGNGNVETSVASILADQSFVAGVEGLQQSAQGEDGPLMADGGAAAEAPKRKRRTKAEMEAERAADLTSKDLSTPTGQMHAVAAATFPAAIEVSTPADGNPFAVAPVMQAVLDAPNQGAATLAAMAAMQNEQTAPVSTVHERALQILANPAGVESIAHLRACQGFIQKYGMTKYNESFKEGLNANIAGYTPEQRALHMAVLESLDA